MRIGAQLYTVRDYMQTERDIARSLERVANIGYKAVQASGHGKIEPERLRRLCDDMDLKIVITHSDPARIINDTEALIAEHDILGCEYIGIGGMPGRYVIDSWIDIFREDFIGPARLMRGRGKHFMYHNHAIEFSMIAGKRVIDRLLDMFSPDEMGFTFDTYWAQAAGCDVRLWIEKLGGRVPVVHLKDMDVIRATNEKKMAPVGEGNMNWLDICAAFEKAGTQWMMVEQDYCERDEFDCLRSSYEYLVSLGYE